MTICLMTAEYLCYTTPSSLLSWLSVFQKASPGKVAVVEAVSPHCHSDVALSGLHPMVSRQCQRCQNVCAIKTEVFWRSLTFSVSEIIWPSSGAMVSFGEDLYRLLKNQAPQPPQERPHFKQATNPFGKTAGTIRKSVTDNITQLLPLPSTQKVVSRLSITKPSFLGSSNSSNEITETPTNPTRVVVSCIRTVSSSTQSLRGTLGTSLHTSIIPISELHP